MKPKHRWGRTRKGKYTTLRQYVHVIKGDNNNFVELQIASGVPASLAIAPIPRSYSNNKLKMAGKPMIRKQQEYIAKRRYWMARRRCITNCRGGRYDETKTY